MTFYCTNEYCGYGEAWRRGCKIPRNKDDTVDKKNRAKSYSQNPSLENRGISEFGGKCIRCMADDERIIDQEERYSSTTY